MSFRDALHLQRRPGIHIPCRGHGFWVRHANARAPRNDDFMLSVRRRKVAAQKETQMADGLRKGLTSYGDAGFSLFLRKAFIKAMGYSDDALNRPIVGITN